MGYMAVASAMFSIIGGIKGKKAARKAAAAEVRVDAQATREQLRQMTYAEQVERSSIIAQYAGSGADVNVGSPLNVMAEQAREYARQRDSVQNAARLRQANIRLRGRNTGQQALWNGITGAFNTLGSANWGG